MASHEMQSVRHLDELHTIADPKAPYERGENLCQGKLMNQRANFCINKPDESSDMTTRWSGVRKGNNSST